MLCVDVSGSYEPALRKQAQASVAEGVTRLLDQGRDTSTIFIRTIGANSYTDQASVGKIVVPALPPTPTQPDLKSNPFEGSASQSKYEEARASAEAAAQEATHQVSKQAEWLRGLDLASSNWTDVGGCIQKASQLLESAGGPRYLLFASDMVDEGKQQYASALSLEGVNVQVIYFPCRDAAACEKLKTRWTDKFHQFKVATISFITPDEPLTVFGDSN